MMLLARIRELKEESEKQRINSLIFLINRQFTTTTILAASLFFFCTYSIKKLL